MTKHLLLGVACALSLRTAAGLSLREGGSRLPAQMPAECDGIGDGNGEANHLTSPDVVTSEQQHQCDILHIINESHDPPRERRRPSINASSDENDTADMSNDGAHLEIGGLVEVYAEQSVFAPPMIIQAKKFDKYILKNMLTNGVLPAVRADFIHPYERYEDGTDAFCNVGGLRKLTLAPCEILSSSTNERGAVFYEVSYLKHGANRVHEQLPFSRVQRSRFIADRATLAEH